MPPLPPRSFPDANTLHPVVLPDGTHHKGTVFLNTAIDHPRMTVGDYTYASAHIPPTDWASHLAPYLYTQSPETLTIGKFCQIADGVTFITSSANHRYDGFSSFPFAVFLDMDLSRPSMPDAGPDTTIGNDVWIGQGATILPGA
jgi:virginiamycin A acetyltransferase